MKKLALSLSLIFAFVGALAAQPALTVTTLNGALSSTAKTVTLTSGTGVTVGSLGNPQTLLIVDKEVMLVVGIVPVGATSGTIFNVFRGWNGSPAQAHNSGASVYIGPPNYFGPLAQGQGDPSGACVAANLPATPFIVLSNGHFFACGSTGQWMMLFSGSPATPFYYTVATLPTCGSATDGSTAYVSDLTTPTYGGTLTGTGAVKAPVFCDGTSWKSR